MLPSLLKNIRNWSWRPENDLLRIYLLDSPPSIGVNEYSDTEGWGDDIKDKNWGQKFFAEWSDPDDRWSSDTLTLTFDNAQLANLNSFLSKNDNEFGFAFDPDCHYYKCGINFDAHAALEPATMLLLGTGLVGLAGFRGKFKK
ncbi:MAG: PEP-CTERM sorting domain-containing protein [Deltaproteobacteria bacterium]|nr:PEP-CTERM sorting domain-containing protein [Deltaproteobacteria bacterium]